MTIMDELFEKRAVAHLDAIIEPSGEVCPVPPGVYSIMNLDAFCSVVLEPSDATDDDQETPCR